MTRGNILVSDEGVFVFSVDGRDRQKVAPGWEKMWICENVYGWTWVGPLDRYPYVDLLVVPYEPSAAERAAIEERFATAATPDGAPELVDPFASPPPCPRCGVPMMPGDGGHYCPYGGPDGEH